MPDISAEVVQQLVNLGVASGSAKIVDGGNVPYAVIPSTHKVENLQNLIYNEHAARPERIKEAVGMLDPDSFCAYYSLFQDPNSRVFAYEPRASVLAVLDYHAAMGGVDGGTPRWGDHTVELTLSNSTEWNIWLGNNNKRFSQAEFAEFLEQHAMDITSPSSASIIDIANDLQGTTEVEWAAGTKLANGNTAFKYSEQTRTTSQGKQIEVPDRFALSIPVFVGGGRVTVNAFLRYRMQNTTKLQFFYTLVRPDEVKRVAFIAARDAIATKLGITILNGCLEK